MTGELAGQVAIVTGGGRGIGRAIARALAGAGAAVAVAARSGRQLAETVTIIRGAGGRALALPTDVTDGRAVERMVKDAERQLGPVDVLVNNAGICAAIGPIWEVDPNLWWRDVEVNLRGTFLCARAVLPGMIARRRGRIMNVSTYAAIRADPYTSGYAGAKAAVLHFTDSLAAATGEHGIRVFALAPGTVRTAMTEYLMESEAGQRWLSKFLNMSANDWVPPERAGELVVSLAAGKGDVLSGRFIHVLDDFEELVRRAEEIQRDDLYTVRLRK